MKLPEAPKWKVVGATAALAGLGVGGVFGAALTSDGSDAPVDPISLQERIALTQRSTSTTVRGDDDRTSSSLSSTLDTQSANSVASVRSAQDPQSANSPASAASPASVASPAAPAAAVAPRPAPAARPAPAPAPRVVSFDSPASAPSAASAASPASVDSP